MNVQALSQSANDRQQGAFHLFLYAAASHDHAHARMHLSSSHLCLNVRVLLQDRQRAHR